MNKTPWTAKEVATLRRIFPHQKLAHVAAAMGRKPGSITNMATRLGLKKSPEFLASVHSGRVQRGQQNEAMRAQHFKPGSVPWNKGTAYNPGGRSAETRFQPGNMPHTWKPVGSYRLTGAKNKPKLLEQKVSEAAGPASLRWVPVSRLVWEAAHGPVPKGKFIVFKPGMKTLVAEEITLDRLDCVDRAEHLRRNHPGRTNPDLARLYQLKGAISRQVNRIKRETEERAQA